MNAAGMHAQLTLSVVLAAALIGGFQEGRAECSMATPRRLYELRVRVLYDGAGQAVEARELVSGDIVLLAAGDSVARA